MIKQERIRLEDLGEFSTCGISGEALEGVIGTGAELRAFLEGYVAAHPDSDGWPQWRNKQTNHLLFAILCHQTQDHCSFCDGYPMKDAMTAETIEHFRPKAGPHQRPDLRLTWENLFACCSGCQNAKLQDWHDDLLKPDEPDYSFSRYFSCEFTTGKIVPKRRATEVAKRKALKTIELYDLNRFAEQRLDMFEFDPFYGPDVPLEKKQFRYWVQAVETARRS